MRHRKGLEDFLHSREVGCCSHEKWRQRFQFKRKEDAIDRVHPLAFLMLKTEGHDIS